MSKLNVLQGLEHSKSGICVGGIWALWRWRKFNDLEFPNFNIVDRCTFTTYHKNFLLLE